MYVFTYSIGVPKKSTVELLMDARPVDLQLKEVDPRRFLVLFRFGRKTSQRFYDAIKKMYDFTVIIRRQNGVIDCFRIEDVYLITKLVEHYGGTWKVYDAQPLEFVDT